MFEIGSIASTLLEVIATEQSANPAITAMGAQNFSRLMTSSSSEKVWLTCDFPR
jgi:hypothetical protein